MKQCKVNDLKPEEFHNVIVSQAVFSFCFNLSRLYINIYFLDVFIRAYFLKLILYDAILGDIRNISDQGLIMT